jgi:hypothetical protein
MLAKFITSGDLHALRRALLAERRHYGVGYLSGPEGEAAEAEFEKLARALGVDDVAG